MNALGNLSIPDQLALKPKGYLTIAPNENGQILNVHRHGQPC